MEAKMHPKHVFFELSHDQLKELVGGSVEETLNVLPDQEADQLINAEKYKRCTVHVYRNFFSVTPNNKMKEVSIMLKAIHVQESKEAAKEKG